jgi:hypothetical protein
MYQPIILDCQTKTVNPNCEDCIVNKTCNLRKEISKYDAEIKVDLEKVTAQCHCETLRLPNFPKIISMLFQKLKI